MTARYWRNPAGVLCGAAILIASIALLATTGRAEDPDPDFKAVHEVCGRCHGTDLFTNKPRSWDRWNDVFADMTQRGATGTDEQLMRVTRYFLENLTLVNVNTSPADELTGVLGVTDEVAKSIIARRQRQAFTNAEQLRSLPGINADILEKRKARILF